MTQRGVGVFPRVDTTQLFRVARPVGRLSTGLDGLDQLVGGGIPSGDATPIIGPMGMGKTGFRYPIR